MNKYHQGLIYVGTIKKNNKIIEENAMIFYDEQKNVFYKIEILNEVYDLQNTKNLSKERLKELDKTIKEKTYIYSAKTNEDKEYIDESTIKLFPGQETLIKPDMKRK